MAGRNIFETFGFASESDSDSDSSDSVPDDGHVDSSSEDAPEEDDVDYEGRDGTQWKTRPFPQGRTGAHNIIREPVRKVLNADHLMDEVSIFQAYITEDMVEKIIRFTNLEGNRKFDTAWKDTDLSEIWALLGILLTCGHLQQNQMDTENIWSESYGIQIVRSTMSRNRFRDLLRALRFDDKSTRGERKAKDKFAPIREIWTDFESALRKYYSPGPNITVDEQLMPFRGRCGFLQYLPSKPDKYGLKVFWAVDSETSYPLTCLPYLGKEERSPQIGLGKSVTLTLCHPFFGSHRIIKADNFFTDMQLASELLSNGLTLVGTVRPNRKFLPANFAQPKGMQKYDSKFAYSPKATIVTYQSKKKKSVTLLSTMHHEGLVDGSEKKKPEIVEYYNSTKGAVDTLDQMAHKYSCKRKTNRWPLVMFTNMVDIAAIAGYLVWKMKNTTIGGGRGKWVAILLFLIVCKFLYTSLNSPLNCTHRLIFTYTHPSIRWPIHKPLSTPPLTLTHPGTHSTIQSSISLTYPIKPR